MADPRNSPEIVTQQELEPVLRNPSFDSARFLALYSEWNNTNDSDRFMEMRAMHEHAGYNNKVGFLDFWKANQEMHEIAAIVQRYQDSKNAVTATAAAATSGVRQTVPTGVIESPVVGNKNTEMVQPYSEKKVAFSEALMAAVSFPFTVKYTENGKSYEVEVTSQGDTIKVGGKSFKLHDFFINIPEISLTKSQVLISDTRIDKKDFKEYIGSLLMKNPGTYDVGSGFEAGKITISGELQPKEIETPKTSIDKTLLEKIKTLQAELDKRINEGLDPVELAEGLKYISDNVPDEPTKQMAINYLVNMLARDYAIVFEKNGSLNVIPKDVKNTATAAQYQNALQSSLNATHVSRANIQESITMLTGQKWSDYARTIADPRTASAQGYAKYLADTYGLDIERTPVSQIQSHKTMTTEDKSWLMSYLNGQMQTLDVVKVTGVYQENLKSYQTLIDSPFFAVLNKATGSGSLTPAQAQAAAEAAARGSSEGGGDGKGATWTLGILAGIIGLGFKKGEGWSLWTALKRIFMGGLAVGGVMLGCAAGREWKKELGMDVCEEAKKAMKDGFKEMKDGITNTATGAAAAPVAPATGAQQAPAVGPTLTATQDAAKKKLEGMGELKSKVSALSSGPKNAPFEKYIEFARSLEGHKLSVLVTPTEPKHSIFNKDSSLDSSIQVPSDMDSVNLKRVIRAYLLGKDIPYSELKDDNGSWEENKGLYNTDSTLGEAIKLTYGTVNTQQNTNNQSGNINEDTIKTFTFPGATVDTTKTNITKNGNDYQAKYTITSIPGANMDPTTQEVMIDYDNQGNLKTPEIAIKTGPSTRQKYRLTKNGSTIAMEAM